MAHAAIRVAGQTYGPTPWAVHQVGDEIVLSLNSMSARLSSSIVMTREQAEAIGDALLISARVERERASEPCEAGPLPAGTVDVDCQR